MRKLVLHDVWAYVAGMLSLSFGVTLQTKADLGVSVLAVPSYLLSMKVGFFTFGMADYTLQLLLVIILAVFVKKMKVKYAFAFVSAVVYGLLLDAMMWLVRDVHATDFYGKIGLYILGAPIFSAIGVALFFRTSMPLMAHDLFVVEISRVTGVRTVVFKIAYDIFFCILSVTMSLLFFGELRGVGVGTIAYACVNGIVIGFWGKWIDRFIIFRRNIKGQKPLGSKQPVE